MIGEQIGSYEITGLLGHGTQGTVYAARHQQLPREAAIKILLPQLSRNQASVDRFFDEARAAASIHHRGVVEVFDCGRDGHGRIYIVMERLVGETLFDRMRRAPLALDEAVAILRELAVALDAAHGHRDAAGRIEPIIHRDLKPENVFLVTSGGTTQVKIVDFGIAKLTSAPRGTGTLTGAGAFGTPPYMSPEQCRGSGEITYRTDLYALGCLLHEMVTGTPPFGFGGVTELVRAHCEEPPPSLAAGAVDVPPELDALATGLLAKDPDARPASCREVIEALDRLPMRGAIAAPPARPPVERTAPLAVATAAPISPPASAGWRDRAWGRLIELPPWSAAGMACGAGATMLGASIATGVGDSYGSAPNWGFNYVVLVPLIVAFMVKALQGSHAALRAMAARGLVRAREGNAASVVAAASQRLGVWFVGLTAAIAVFAAASCLGDWLHRYRFQPLPGAWWTDSPIVGVAGAVMQTLLVTATIVFFVHGIAWSQLMQSWTVPGSTLRLDVAPAAPAAQRGADVLEEPVVYSLLAGILVQVTLYLSKVHYLAESTGRSVLRVVLPDPAAPLAGLLDPGSGLYPSTTPLIGSAMVAGFLIATMFTLRRTAGWPVAALSFGGAAGLLITFLVASIFYRLGPVVLAAILLLVLWRALRRTARAAE